MNVLVTGGLGFIGSRIVRKHVLAGDLVWVFTRSMIKEKNIEDLRSGVMVYGGPYRPEIFADVDVVYHCAATTHNYHIFDNPHHDIAVNCAGTIDLLEMCRQHCPEAKIVYVSTFFVHGFWKESAGVSALDLPLPLGLYGATRLAGEHFCRIYNNVSDMNCVVARLCNVFGPEMFFDDTPKGAFNRMTQHLVKGETIGLYEGNQIHQRDYIYVDDVVDALVLLAEKGNRNGTYYVGTGRGSTLQQMFDVVIDQLGRGKYEWKEVPAFHKAVGIKSFVCDPTPLRALGWEEKVFIPEGIRRMIEFYGSE